MNSPINSRNKNPLITSLDWFNNIGNTIDLTEGSETQNFRNLQLIAFPTKLTTRSIYGQDYDCPDTVNLTSFGRSSTAFTVTDSLFAAQASYNAGLAANIGVGFFSASLDASFNANSSSSEQIHCAFNHSMIRPINVQVKRQGLEKYLPAEFLTDVNDDNKGFMELFEKWGTHLITGITVGGDFILSVFEKATSLNTYKSFQANISASYSGLFASGSLDASYSEKLSKFNSDYKYQSTINLRGGEISPDFEKWVDSIAAENLGVLCYKELLPLATFAKSTDRKKYLTQGFNIYTLLKSLQNPVFESKIFRLDSPGDNRGYTQSTEIKGFKIISGGYKIHGSNPPANPDYPSGSFPTIEKGDGTINVHQIGSWEFQLYRGGPPISYPYFLEGYIMVVHDPGDLLGFLIARSFSPSNPVPAVAAKDEIKKYKAVLISGGGFLETDIMGRNSYDPGSSSWMISFNLTPPQRSHVYSIYIYLKAIGPFIDGDNFQWETKFFQNQEPNPKPSISTDSDYSLLSGGGSYAATQSYPEKNDGTMSWICLMSNVDEVISAIGLKISFS